MTELARCIEIGSGKRKSAGHRDQPARKRPLAAGADTCHDAATKTLSTSCRDLFTPETDQIMRVRQTHHRCRAG